MNKIIAGLVFALLWGSGSVTIKLGIVVAVFPLLKVAYATPFGVGLMAFSMLCYSVTTVYYQSIDWSLSKWSINGWQIL
jgi:probable blue pigment (indigoidine) exporter